MANENDEVQQNNHSNSSNGSVLDTLPTQEHANDARATQADSNEDDTTTATADITEGINSCARRGKLNDLVADLCINDNGAERVSASTSGSGGGFGDYTNIRATLGPASYTEAGSSQTTSTQQPHAVTVAPTQNSSFSFKHFLNSSSSALTAPSTTITSLDPVLSGTSSSVTNVAITSSSSALQTSTGARPKVPQSASSTSSISSLMSGLSVGGTQDTNNSFTSAATRMKRSPRFSSFDSQASLAEYAGVSERAESNLEDSTVGAGGVTSSGFRLYPDALGTGSANESSDFFSTRYSTGAGVNSTISGSQYVPRSYSNYEMPIPTASPRRRMANSNAAKEARPTRLALNTNSSAKLKLDLPIDNAASNTTRPLPNNVGDYAPPPPGAAAAAALPDFVQDHWMDSWYAHEMHLNSPPISPIRDFVEDITGAALGASNVVSGGGSGGGVSIGGGVSGVALGSAEAAASCGGPSVSANSAGESSGASKMLPDFLSDGPIIHSSQRLADVAAGLPSNSIGSPDDPPMSSQLSRLRIDNERLQRELNDARLVLNEQIRRGNELERQLQERQRSENNYSRAQNMPLGTSEEDKNKRRTAAPSQNHITKLKQQVTQLTAEVETLRRENETLREEGAVGGCSASSCDRPYATATAGAGVRGNSGRPSRTQQISRDLLRAAANAESNLRQLLTGVDNLRQMAADIESSELRLDYDVSPDLFSDFLDECDDYEEYPGGPAL